MLCECKPGIHFLLPGSGHIECMVLIASSQPVETIRAVAGFCGSHKLHFVSDEIYAHSVFDNPNVPNAIPFTSSIALDLTSLIDPLYHHVLYGASKDFCANGLRLGFICSQNAGVLAATSSNA